MGIEPTSSAWEAEVMAIIRRPQNAQFYRGSGGDGKREVLGGGGETGIARCWSGGVAGGVGRALCHSRDLPSRRKAHPFCALSYRGRISTARRMCRIRFSSDSYVNARCDMLPALVGYILVTCRLRYNSADITGEPSS
jgi:hypothetical protein